MGARDTVRFLTEPLGTGDPSHVPYTSTIKGMPLLCGGMGDRYLGPFANKIGGGSPLEVMVESTDALLSAVKKMAARIVAASVGEGACFYRLLGPPGVGKSTRMPGLMLQEAGLSIVLLEPQVGLCHQTVGTLNAVAGSDVATVVDGESAVAVSRSSGIYVMTPAQYIAGSVSSAAHHSIPLEHIILHDEAHESDWASYTVRALYTRKVFKNAKAYVQLSASISSANARGAFPSRGAGMPTLQVNEVQGIVDPTKWVLHGSAAQGKPWSVEAMHGHKTLLFIDGDLMSHRLQHAYDAAGLISLRLDRNSTPTAIGSVLSEFNAATTAVLVLDSSYQSGYNFAGADRVLDTGTFRSTIYESITKSVGDSVRFVSPGERLQRMSRVGRAGPGVAYTIPRSECHQAEADITGEERAYVMASFRLLGAQMLVTDRFASDIVDVEDPTTAYGLITSGMPWLSWVANPAYPDVLLCESSDVRPAPSLSDGLSSSTGSWDSSGLGTNRKSNGQDFRARKAEVGGERHWSQYIRDFQGVQTPGFARPRNGDVNDNSPANDLLVCDQTQGMTSSIPVPLMFTGYVSIMDALAANKVPVGDMDYQLRIYVAYVLCREYNGVALHRAALDGIANQLPMGLDVKELPSTITKWLIDTYAKLNSQQYRLNKMTGVAIELSETGLTFSYTPIDQETLEAVQAQLLPDDWFDMLHAIGTYLNRSNRMRDEGPIMISEAGDDFFKDLNYGHNSRRVILSEQAWVVDKRPTGALPRSGYMRGRIQDSPGGNYDTRSNATDKGVPRTAVPGGKLEEIRRKAKWSVGASTWYAPGVQRPDGSVGSGRSGKYHMCPTPSHV